jgi:hypothetical protein
MSLDDDLERIRKAAATLTVAADKANQVIIETEVRLNEAGAGANVLLRLVEPEVAGWSLGWARKSKEKGWQFITTFREFSYPLLQAPRLVRVVAVEHLPEIASALAAKLEAIVAKHMNGDS